MSCNMSTIFAIFTIFFCNAACFRLDVPKTQNETSEEPEQLFKGKTAEEILQIVDPFSGNPSDLFEGDIITDKRSRKAVTSSSLLWTGSRVSYSFAASIDATTRRLIRRVISDYESKTCLRFRDVTNSPSGNYAQFYKGNGCSSSVGMIGGRQLISIATGCARFGIVTHEIGHALGLYHEQSRNDRDRFVQILSTNIKPGLERNFQKQSTRHYGVPFDYTSVMHYKSDAFTSNRFVKNTIVTKQIAYTYKIGQRLALSFLDIKILNSMYSCNRNCATKNCGNRGGYVGPNCRCVCPPGFRGANCQSGAPENALSCGHNIGATSVGQTFQISTPGYPKRRANGFCAWEINSPPNTRIQVTFNGFHFIAGEKNMSNKCVQEWVELRTSDMNAGPFYCGTDLRGQTKSSSRNKMRIIVNPSSDVSKKGLSATIKIVS